MIRIREAGLVHYVDQPGLLVTACGRPFSLAAVSQEHEAAPMSEVCPDCCAAPHLAGPAMSRKDATVIGLGQRVRDKVSGFANREAVLR